MWSFGTRIRFQIKYARHGENVFVNLMLRLPFYAGCILAELHTGYPLFPGENEVEQLACIMEIIGLPPYEVLMRATRRKYFFGKRFRL